jgi:hypothetical protein
MLAPLFSQNQNMPIGVLATTIPKNIFMDNPFETIYSRLDTVLARLEAMDKRLDIATSPGNPNGLISKREAANILNCTTQTIDNRVKQGLLKKQTVGSRSKFVRREVMALIK